MSLKSNPFYVLGATPSDDRRRIMALANDRRLDGDETAIREARIVLTTPRKRLAAEIAWLPGLEKDEIRRAMEAENEHPGAVLRMTDLPALTRANLMADGLVQADPQAISNLAAWWIVELADAHDRIRADRVTTSVNEARLAAGVPMASQQDVVEELRGRHHHFRDAIERCMDGLAFERMVEIVTLVVNRATLESARHAPPLIDSLIDSYYERRVREKMAAKRQEIRKLVSQARGRVGINVAGIVAQLERAVVAWDVMAQPIQVSLASRGMSHSASNDVMHEVRNLAVELFNEHKLLEVAQSLTKILREVFAEMEPITEILDKDVSVFDGIAKRVKAARSQQVTASTTHTAHTARPRVAEAVSSRSTYRLTTVFRRIAFGAVVIATIAAIAITNDRRSRPAAESRGRTEDIGSTLVAKPPVSNPLRDPLALMETVPAQPASSDTLSTRRTRTGDSPTIRNRQENPDEPRSTRKATSEVVYEEVGRGPDVVAITLPAGKYVAFVGVTGNGEGMAHVSAEPLSNDSRWLFKSGRSVRGVKSFSLPRLEVLYVDVGVSQNAQWTIRIDRAASGGDDGSSRSTRRATSEAVFEETGRGPDVVAITLPAGKYVAFVGVTGNGEGMAHVSAEPLSNDSRWLFKSGRSVRGVKSFSLPRLEVLYVDVGVSQNAQWTIRIDRIVG